MSRSDSSKKPSRLSDLVYLGLIGFNVWLLVAHPSDRASSTALRIGVVAFCTVGFLLNRVARRARTPEDAAADMLRQQKAIYGGPHEFVRVGEDAFKGLDLAFYERTGAFLYSQGFGYLADIQDKTAQAEFRWAHSVIRVMLGEGGTASAGVYHLRLLGMFRVLQWVGVLSRRMKILDIETELTDGTFVVTANSRGADSTGDVPGVERHRMPQDTPPAEQLDAHRAHVRAALAARPGASAVVMRDFTDAIEMQHRLQALKNAHKQSIGYLDAQELRTIMGGKLDATGQTVAMELERLKLQERLAAAAGPQPPPAPPPPFSRQA